ncbi:MAG: phosphoribosyltransferase family protein [Desulfobaccales bacterium]
MGKLIEDATLRDRIHVFVDRANAGQLLARHLTGYGQEVHLYAIPAGGVPVAAEIARVLAIPLDLIIVRKIQLPWTTEAGFGALDPAGQAVLNEDMLRRMPLSPEDIEAQVRKTTTVMRQREARLRGGKPYARLDGQVAMMVDDGLASGYTMRAALRFLKAQGAGRLIIAVPTGSERTVWELLPEVDELYCLNVRGGFSFAVADAYENWYDLTEKEVLEILGTLDLLHPSTG